jgi:nucleotide-binding universal stress UspA family protein
MTDAGPARPAALRVVVVGDDGSPGGAAAVEFAATLASASGAEVVVVEAYSPLDELGTAKPPVEFARLEAEARRRLEVARARPLRERGVAHRVVLVEDPDAIGVLARAADEVDADLVVVGSHGRTGWRERILGSVATKLPHAVSCPVTIVPSPRT